MRSSGTYTSIFAKIAAAIVILIVGGCSAQVKDSSRELVVDTSPLAGAPVSFEVCGVDSNWVRPSEEMQQRHLHTLGRYVGVEESIAEYLWSENFLINYGSASVEYDMLNLSGLWTLPTDVRATCLNTGTAADLMHSTVELWVLLHKVNAITYSDASYTIVVEPVEKGAEFVRFSRATQEPLTLRFVTLDGSEVAQIVETAFPFFPK